MIRKFKLLQILLSVFAFAIIALFYSNRVHASQVYAPAWHNQLGCYGVSDNTDELYLYLKRPNTTVSIGSNGTANDIETLAFEPSKTTLYAFNRKANNKTYLGTIDRTTGQFTAIGPAVDADGRAKGAEGQKRIQDIDAMTFDPSTGVIYAAANRERASHKRRLLIQIDPTTGKLIRNAFGPGTDYV